MESLFEFAMRFMIDLSARTSFLSFPQIVSISPPVTSFEVTVKKSVPRPVAMVRSLEDWQRISS